MVALYGLSSMDLLNDLRAERERSFPRILASGTFLTLTRLARATTPVLVFRRLLKDQQESCRYDQIRQPCIMAARD
jgi:hypothetical protein